MTKKILFVCERWCDANPEMGLTNHYHNLFGALKRSKLDVEFKVVHFDEARLVYNSHIDNILPKVAKQFQPDIIMVSLLGKYPFNPTMNCLDQVRKQTKSKLCFIWCDTGNDWGKPQIQGIGNIADLHISWDVPADEPVCSNHINLWTPEDPKLFYFEQNKKTDLSFIGSPRYQDRAMSLQYLISKQLPIMVRGGQREQKLIPEQYASFLRGTKISINFSFSPDGIFQLKGRVLESLASGCLLLEQENKHTNSMFTPNVDYVPFSNPEELAQKAAYYLEHEDERKKIAAAGNKKFLENYTVEHYWNKVFERLGIK
jgi:hypothetical protein